MTEKYKSNCKPHFTLFNSERREAKNRKTTTSVLFIRKTAKKKKKMEKSADEAISRHFQRLYRGIR